MNRKWNPSDNVIYRECETNDTNKQVVANDDRILFNTVYHTSKNEMASNSVNCLFEEKLQHLLLTRHPFY